MELVLNALKMLAVLYLYFVLIKIWMMVASYIGEALGYGRFFMSILQKLENKKEC